MIINSNWFISQEIFIIFLFVNKSLFVRILFQIAILSFKLWETNIINVYVRRIWKKWNSSGWNLFIMLHNKKSTGSKQTNITISLGKNTKSWTHRQICVALWQEGYYWKWCLAYIHPIINQTVPYTNIKRNSCKTRYPFQVNYNRIEWS